MQYRARRWPMFVVCAAVGLVAMLAAPALAGTNVRAAEAPAERATEGHCVTVAAMEGTLVRTELPAGVAASDIIVTRKGHNLDKNEDGWGFVGPYSLAAIATERSERTTVFVNVFRDDKQAGRFCFTLKWWRL